MARRLSSAGVREKCGSSVAVDELGGGTDFRGLMSNVDIVEREAVRVRRRRGDRSGRQSTLLKYRGDTGGASILENDRLRCMRILEIQGV